MRHPMSDHRLTEAQRKAITEAAHKHAAETARAQGLPPTITDPDVLRKLAALLPTRRRPAA